MAGKPEIKQLSLDLKKLVFWELFAAQLPGIEKHDIQMIKRGESIPELQKQDLYGKWLSKCPDASWKHVVDALCAVDEEDLATEISKKYSVPLPKDKNSAAATTENSKTTGCKAL